jgi:hypothetical protein
MKPDELEVSSVNSEIYKMDLISIMQRRRKSSWGGL